MKKRNICLFSCLFTVLFFFTPLQAQTAQGVDAGNVVCPVSGDKVSEKAFADYEGKRYHFCCKMCVKDFRKDPKKFVAKLVPRQS